MRQVLASCVVAVAVVCSWAGVTAQPHTGQDVIRAMHDRYAATWYPTLSFIQRVVWTDGRPDEEWFEAMQLPGRLRIDVAPVEAAPRTIIFRDGMRYNFEKGVLKSSAKSQNLLLVLGFDLYRQAPEATIALLQAQGFDLSKVREDTWDGHAVFVVGADAGDLTSRQFWIEKERLLFVRLIQKSSASDAVADIRFAKYDPIGSAWLGTVVVFMTNGKETYREVYRDWQVNPKVTDSLFDTNTWKPAGWR